ncbi:glycosyltransferase family 2 protein [candidate division CSSED10-310 bacterium]|uniref:Glycosyltransferase family 2 protein n=1 Tax=candidate division CSSED10-310 bacterium TaxID=2855610 RepID=A0ABV6YUV0_UNCC1
MSILVMTTISVIIPTRGKHSLLQEVCATLLVQNGIETGEIEIIIVGDGLEEPEKLCFTDQALPLKIHYERREHKGPASARNYGAALSSSPLLLFLGNDTKAMPDLLSSHVQFHDQHQNCACLGKIRNPEHLKPNHLERFLNQGSQFHFPEKDGLLDFWHFYTANISVPRSLFMELGGFREEFPAAGWEDSEFGYRFSKKYHIRYHSQAEVIHVHPVTLESFKSRQRQLGRDAHLLLDIHPELDTFFKIRHYPIRRILKCFLSSSAPRRVLLALYPFIEKLAYSRIVHYYFRILRYHFFFAGYQENS